jgi:MFS family permease
MPEPTTPHGARTLLLSSSIGTIIEWYDFFVFASAAALVFDATFFPRVDPRTGILLSLMTYAVGFLTRPLGGIVFGVLGDRYGRKRALIWSLTLMGVATMGVGLVPGYASIGVAAPALLVLLRLVQGLAVGGEVGGALLLVAESLPADRRGFWTAWPMIGGAAGNLLASGALALLGFALSESAFAIWGWRLAFLASGVLIGVGIWIRRRVDESPLYLAYVARRAGSPKTRIGPTLAAHWQSVLTVLLVKCGENALFYVFSTFFVELFPTNARYTGFSLGYQMATVFAGAVAPLIGLALLRAYGTTLPVSLYAAAMTGPGLVCLGLSNETRGRDLGID